MIDVRCFGNLAQLESLRGQINSLNQAAGRPDPFSTFEFFEAFLQHDQPDAQGQVLHLWFLTAFEGARLVGYMALKQETHRVLGMLASKLEFLVTHDADRPHLVARTEDAPAVSEAFYAYLLKRRGEWTFLEFREQDATSRLFPPPTAAKLGGYAVRQWPGLENGTIHVRWNTLEAYFQSFSKRFRSNVSRQMRSLLGAGQVEYLSSSDPAATPALFEIYQGIEQRSWKADAGAAIGRHPQWAGYFGDLLAAGQPMHVSIHILLLDGTPVAGLITGAFGAGLYALHIVFDDSLRRLAPGSAMLLMGMRQAIEGRFAFVNLLSGFGYFKARWQAEMSSTRNAQIYRVGTPYFWRRVSGDLARGLRGAAGPRRLALSNPARRAAAQAAGSAPDAGLRTAGTPVADRRRTAALIARAREGRAEFLSAAELAALMPFAARRPAAMPGRAAARPAQPRE